MEVSARLWAKEKRGRKMRIQIADRAGIVRLLVENGKIERLARISNFHLNEECVLCRSREEVHSAPG